MKLAVWTYEGPPHVGAMRVATAMRGVHYVLHAPQGDTYADLLFTMIERRDRRPPVTYTTFQARDLGGDTADLFKTAARDAFERFQPDAMLVGASCTAELIQDDPGGLARALDLPCPVIPLDLPSYQKKELWGAAETFYAIVRALAQPRLGERTAAPSCNILGPVALGFRHRDDLREVRSLLDRLGVAVNVVAPWEAAAADVARLAQADFNVVLYPEIAGAAASWLERAFGQPSVRVQPVGLGATREWIAEVARIAGVDPQPALADAASRAGWWSRSVDSTYLTGKRVFVFGEANRAIAAARVAREEMGFEVVGLGAYNREFARELRAAAAEHGVTPLLTDDYLEVEAAIAEAQPELVLGTQMERHIAKRLRIACAVISGPAHVQDFPARHSPQMGWEGANVLFDTWVHPLVMGLEEHLLHMFRDDFEFNDAAGPSHLGSARSPAAPSTPPEVAEAPTAAVWTDAAVAELSKIRSSCAARRAATRRPSPRIRGWRRSNSRRSMKPAATSRAEGGAALSPVRVVVVTLDKHLNGVFARAAEALRRDIPGLTLDLHAAVDWADDREALARCTRDIDRGDIVIATMLFMEDHVRSVLPALAARRDHCDAMVGVMSAGEVVKLTRLGSLRMDGSDKGPIAMLKRLRGSKKTGSSGAGQMAMLRRLPKLLRFIPGPAQDLRAYFLTMQYWLSGSQDNVADMVRFLVGRYADGDRRALRGHVEAGAPRGYPEVGLYHPRAVGRIVERLDALPAPAAQPLGDAVGVVGVLVLRSYVLAEDAGHYDGVIAALEATGLRVIPAFASGLDARPAIERFFMADGSATVDAVVSLSGFSLVGGPAYNDSAAAEEMLATLDVPYISAQPLEFQTLETWGASAAGLMPVEATIMLAIPELDGAVAPMVFGGRADGSAPCQGCGRGCHFEADASAPRMRSCPERAQALAAKVARMARQRRTARADRRVAIVLFNFPPNSGAVGSAAFLSVFASLHNTLTRLKAEGYDVEVPPTVEALRERLIQGNAARFGTDANVVARIAADDHVRRERWLDEIEAQWGPAPGKVLSNGSSIFVLGERFGNVLVGLQPGFGYEGDPMRLLFERGFAPTHAFSAFYRYLREDFDADAVLHFGTHGALEFMPGKQAGLSGNDWPERLIGDLPNLYLYAANNPSEGALARRRSGATLISYLTPPIAKAGLYKGLVELKASLQRWRSTPTEAAERPALATLIREQAVVLDLAGASDAPIPALAEQVFELEQALIPHGLHVVGQAATPEERVDLLAAMSEGRGPDAPSRPSLQLLVGGAPPEIAAAVDGPRPTREAVSLLAELAAVDAHLARDSELDAVVHALDGGYIRPAPSGDLVRTPAILPTGRNLHGFDPFHIPSVFALREGAAQARLVLDRHLADTGATPESIAMVLWGSDNLKSEGAPIGQTLALMGARPRFDSYGRLCGAELIPLAELGRPRIDVVVTLSGIFRDLLALQTRMIAEAAWLAASADEPPELNFVRKHALAHMAEQGCDLETAALRVFSNADGAYGANVNQLIDSGAWSDEDELADTYLARKGFAYGRTGAAVKQTAVLAAILKGVDFAYQNVESVELGVTSIDQYVDTLGGISRAVKRARGSDAPVYIGDQTSGAAKVRTLGEQVALETRTRMLNPKWYEGLLSHGYEGVRQIEAGVTTTLGWSATTRQVDPWIYQQISETYVLDDAMRRRLSGLNPVASSRMAKRLIEACERQLWTPDAATLAALHHASDELEDRLEGVATAA